MLPGTDIPIERDYTVILRIDSRLRALQAFCATVVDGSAPGLSLFGLLFVGNLVSIFGVFLIATFREGSKDGLIGSSVLMR